jgi:hypothetical protein
MIKDKMTITADLMYLIVLGDDTALTKIINKLNDPSNIPTNKYPKNTKISKNTKQLIYIKHDISIPCSELMDQDIVINILKSDAIKRIKKIHGDNYQPHSHDIDKHIRFVNPGDGVESAQIYAYADISGTDNLSKMVNPTNADDLKMLMIIRDKDNEKHFELTYPDITLGSEEDAGTLVSRWLKVHNLNEMIKQMIVRPVNIVGKDNEILVFTAFVKDII